MLPSWCDDAVTVVRPGSKTSRGTTVPDWSASAATETKVTGCSVQTPSTTMTLDMRQQTALAGVLYAPPGTDVSAGDRIDWTDPMGVAHSFAVVGVPMPWKSPTGRVSHVRCELAEWRG